MKTKTKKAIEPEEEVTIEDERYYVMNVENLTINVNEGGKVWFLQGKPLPPPPPPHQ